MGINYHPACSQSMMPTTRLARTRMLDGLRSPWANTGGGHGPSCFLTIALISLQSSSSSWSGWSSGRSPWRSQRWNSWVVLNGPKRGQDRGIRASRKESAEDAVAVLLRQCFPRPRKRHAADPVHDDDCSVLVDKGAVHTGDGNGCLAGHESHGCGLDEVCKRPGLDDQIPGDRDAGAPWS
ncbi:uncharacterized protein P884DRAFT_260454 [Thermothelomyces heterothallicus CBS 202.75]|uniref:uncharacterized protein n=1 Tax=Thermothelomyces heterothallicus CBS 202.75 TaxID=1149848 RepID=UPI003744191F